MNRRIESEYPLHKQVYLDDVEELKKVLNGAEPEDLEKLDCRGRLVRHSTRCAWKFLPILWGCCGIWGSNKRIKAVVIQFYWDAPGIPFLFFY